MVDQAETGVGKALYEEVLGKSLGQIRRQWTKLLLYGQASAPLQCTSDKIVKKAVASSPHGIRYISTDSLDETVKEIMRIRPEKRETE